MRLNRVRALGWVLIGRGVSGGSAADGRHGSCFELPHFIMQRRMMLTIKAPAERGGGLEFSMRTGR